MKLEASSKRCYNVVMKTWKLALIIWGPAILILLSYGIAYGTSYLHVKHQISQSKIAFNKCENPDFNDGGTMIPNIAPVFVPNCQNPGSITHGFLWMPRFKPGDFN